VGNGGFPHSGHESFENLGEKMSGSTNRVRVALNCRPLLPHEVDEGCQKSLFCNPSMSTICTANADKMFTFDHVYDETVECEKVFNDCVKPLLSDALQGFNATVFAYGQTGAGKTHTMNNFIIPRVAQDLFASMTEETTLKASYFQIYREEIIDLLSPSPSKALVIREDSNRKVFVTGQSSWEIKSGKALMHLLQEGASNRTTASTKMNSTSSRSHAILTLTISSSNEDGVHKKSMFHLVDLAGSERVKRTKCSGDRFLEGVDINRGLLALGNVISALSSDEQHHVPYRDSKLTRILQDSLGGNCKTCMICCVSPSDTNLFESLNTLKYANRAKSIQNKAIANTALDNGNPNLISRLRKTIEDLREENSRLRTAFGRDKRPLEAVEAREKSKSANSVLMKLMQRNIALQSRVTKLEATYGMEESSEVLDDAEDQDRSFDEEDEEHLQNQMKLQQELDQVENELNAKICTISAMSVSEKELDRLGLSYSKALTDLSEELAKVEAERDDLLCQISHQLPGQNPREQILRTKLKALEDKLCALQTQQKKQERLLKVQKKNAAGLDALKR